MKRLLIYEFYDEDGIVDNYVGYILSQLKMLCDYIVFVTNMSNINKGYNENVKPYVDKIIYRDDKGLDVGAFQDAMCNRLGWEFIYQFEEMVMCNDTIYGPFIPMTEIFDKMDKQSVDFWGLIDSGALQIGNVYIPRHIIMSFIVIKTRMLISEEFRRYWEEMPKYDSYYDIVINHEVQFAKHFYELGYSWSVFSTANEYYSENPSDNCSLIYKAPLDLIEKFNFPFIKKRTFRWELDDHLRKQSNDQLIRAIKYVDNYTEYDVNLIWDNIIRTIDPERLVETLNLYNIINTSNYNEDEKTCFNDMCVLTSNGLIDEIYEAVPWIRGRIELYGERDTLKAIADYRYCFFIQPEVMSLENRYYISELYRIIVNTIKDEGYVREVRRVFESQKRLGMLKVPQGFYGSQSIGYDYWIGGCIRTEILSRLDFSNLLEALRNEKNLRVITQHGYYSAYVMSDEYASMQINSLKYGIDYTISRMKGKKYADYFEMIDFATKEGIISRFKKYLAWLIRKQMSLYDR